MTDTSLNGLVTKIVDGTRTLANQTNGNTEVLTDAEAFTLLYTAMGYGVSEHPYFDGSEGFKSKHTVKGQLTDVYSKLQLFDSVQPVILAYELGWIQHEEIIQSPDVKYAGPIDDKVGNFYFGILSPREKQVYFWLARGFSEKEIARPLCMNLALQTIKNYKTTTFEKLGFSKVGNKKRNYTHILVLGYIHGLDEQNDFRFHGASEQLGL